MTRISQDGIYILICVGITLFIIMICLIKSLVEDYFKYRRRNRIIPLQTLLRVRQERLNREERERYVIEIEKYNKVMEELKNNIIVINPDNTMSLGISYSSNHD